MNSHLKPRILSIATAVMLGASTLWAASDGVYPLTENTWDNPDFKKRFLGSYGFDMEINPKITHDESTQMQQVAELMNSAPNEAIKLLKAFLTPESSAAFEYTIGSLYLQQGKLPEAKEYYRAAIKKFPNFYRAYQNLGFTLVQERMYAEAKPMLIEAIEIGGGNGTLYGLLGYCFLNTKDSSLSLDAYRQALLFQPDSKDWLLGKLNALLDTGMTQEAIGMLSEMIEKDPSQANYWMMQANAYLGEQEYDKAMANLELVARMGEPSPEALALLGDIMLSQGVPHIAVERYESAIKSGKLSASKMLRMAEGLAIRGSMKESLQIAQTVLDTHKGRLTPDEELSALNIQASAAIALGDMDRAASVLEAVIDKDPLNGKALVSLGDYYREKGDTENALIQYERAAKVKDFEAKALIAMARLKIAQKDYKTALSHLRRANSLEPKSYLDDYIAQLENAIKSS